MMNEKTQFGFILLIGVPGSGKSYFRKSIENYFKENTQSEFGMVQIYSVCYDDYFKVKNPSPLCDGNKWKNDRLDILKAVENIVVKLKSYKSTDLNDSFSNFFIVNGNVHKPDTTLIVIDDNMYYRSMRFEYFKLAKSNNWSFCQIFFNVSLEDALKYNRNRSLEDQVPNSVIENMYNKIEPPLHYNTWERHSVTTVSYTDYNNVSNFIGIFDCIKKSLENPISQNDTNNRLAKEESRKVNNSNALHQIDNISKQVVGLIIRENLKSCCKSKTYALSQFYSDKRLGLLRQIKEGEIPLPIDLSKPITSVEIVTLKSFLFELLKA